MLPLPQFHQPAPDAGCGECTACCVVAAIPDLGKPFYARCFHLNHNCSIYDQRPDRCRQYRCAWHLGMLGPRADRRPDQCGVIFQYEPQPDGKWILGIYELSAGAASSQKTRYLKDIILQSKQTRHLPMSNPAVQIIPFGADVPVDFEISDRFDYSSASGPPPMKLEAQARVFVGKCRGILEPREANQSAASAPTSATGPQTDPASEAPPAR